MTSRLKRLRVSGTSLGGHLTNITDSVKFSAAIDLVPAVKFVFSDDHELSLFRSRMFDQGATVTYADWTLTVADVDLKPTPAGPKLAVEARSAVVTDWQDEHGPKTWSNADVSQWFTDRCRDVGAIPVVQPGLGRRTLIRETGRQSTWDVISQTKRELGLWLFERGRKVIIGRPSWIIRQAEHISTWAFAWNSFYDYSDSLAGMPVYSGRNSRLEDQTMTIQLISEDADDIRLGDRVDMAGALTGQWIVSKVLYPILSTAPVEAICVRPVDPSTDSAPAHSGLGRSESGAWATTPAFSGGDSGATPQISLSNLPSEVAGYRGGQLVNAAHIIRTNQALGHPKRAAQIAVMVAMAESSLRVLNYGSDVDPTRRGLFQQGEDGWGTYLQRMDPTASAAAFLRSLVEVTNWQGLPPAEAGHYAQRNASPSFYLDYWAEAVTVVDAVLATATSSGGVTLGGTVPPGLSSAVDRYVNQVRGKSIDFDRADGNRSSDLAAHYAVSMGGPSIKGQARDWWNTGRASGFFTAVATDSAGRKGDVACWKTSAGGGRGHVAVVLQDQGSTLRVLTQNPGPPAVVSLSKNGLQGYLRPKRWR